MKDKIVDKTIYIASVTFVVLLCIVCLYPYLNQVALAFNEGKDAARGGIGLIPRKFTTENFVAVFRDKRLLRAAVVTISAMLVTVGLHIIVVFFSAYGLTRRNLVGRKFISIFFLIPTYLSAGTIPVYFLYRELGLINNYLVYIIPGIFSFYNMVVVRSFIQDIPISLEESATIDGANEVQILFKIIMPISKPVMATVTLWTAVAKWNDWNTTLYYITKEKLYSLQYVAMSIIKSGNQVDLKAMEEGTESAIMVTEASLKSAVLVATSLPIIMIYPFLQKYFMKGMTLGAVKE